MVCLTSCVFRSIRFSGFARPHVGVRREGELYTHAQGGGKRSMGSTRDAHKSGKNNGLGAFPARRGARTPTPCAAPSPADSRGPTGRLPLHAEARTSHVAHAAGFGSPPHAQAPHLASQRGRPRDRRGLPMHRDPRSPSPPPSPCEPAGPPCICQGPGPGRRAGRTRRRARPLPNARRATFRPTAAKAATRPIRQASLPAVLQPSGPPPPAQKSPRPKASLGCGLKEQVQVRICLTSRRPDGGRRWP